MPDVCTTEPEIWKPAVRFEGAYEVSNLGRVRSLDRIVTAKNGVTASLRGKILRQSSDRVYPMVQLYPLGKGQTPMKVHRLVLEAFVGPCPPGMECRHLNGDPLDARLANLAWGTESQNRRDQVAHGTSIQGEQNPMARLTPKQVKEVKEIFREVREEIAREFGVSVRTIADIFRGTSWKHIPEAPG